MKFKNKLILLKMAITTALTVVIGVFASIAITASSALSESKLLINTLIWILVIVICVGVNVLILDESEKRTNEFYSRKREIEKLETMLNIESAKYTKIVNEAKRFQTKNSELYINILENEETVLSSYRNELITAITNYNLFIENKFNKSWLMLTEEEFEKEYKFIIFEETNNEKN